jgi:shikimate kinase
MAAIGGGYAGGVTSTGHLVLLGLMGSGKTSIGRLVADHLQRPLVDGDEELEALTGGRSAADVEAAEGIDALHQLEEKVAMAALGRTQPSVIGPAASVCDSAAVRHMLVDQTVVWLSAPVGYLAEHAAEKDHRPLVDSPDLEGLLREQLVRRRASLGEVVDLDIDVTAGSKDDAADAITAFLERGRP